MADKKITIASYNCRGLGDRFKRRDVFHYLKSKKFSIYCLQDVHWTNEIEHLVKNEWGFKCFFNSYKSNSRGVAIFFHNNLDFTVHGSLKDDNGNTLILDVELEGIRMNLVNIYGPNADSPEFYIKLMEMTTKLDNAFSIFCGDWNMILNPELDCIGYTNINNPRARERVTDWCDSGNLIDP